MQIYLSRPDITDREIEAVCAVLRSPDLSLGPRLGQFEQAFADYIGRKRAVAVNSGTSGLFLCMLTLGIGPGDEIITTPFTFIASATSIMMAGAKPVFVDIDPVSLNINPAKIESAITEKAKAVLPVEIFGNPAGFDTICEIARKHNLPVKEVGAALYEMPYATAFYKQCDPAIIKAYNQALREIRTDGTFMRISEKWFGTDR